MKAKAETKSTAPGRRLVLSLAVSVLSLAGAWAVAAGFDSSTADAPAPAVTRPGDGRAMFVQSCSHCHGDDATGDGEDGDGPDLRGLRISNARIATVIREGIHGEMPSFAKKYSAGETATLVEYLRSLR
jgi:mono/diheme cytochrome c family protein